MRCYFMRDGHIAGVEVLSERTDDAAAMREAQVLFEERKDEFHGFEIWDRARFVFRYPAVPADTGQSSERDA